MSLTAQEISALLQEAEPNELEIKALLIGSLLGAERNSPGIVVNTLLLMELSRSMNGGQKLTADAEWPSL